MNALANAPAPDKTDHFEILGVELQWMLTPADTLDQYCVLAATIPPGAGVPPHQHPQQEAFFVLEGAATFAIDTGNGLQWNDYTPGEMVNIPPNRLHGFRNTMSENVKVLITCQADLGKFFKAAGSPLHEGQSISTHLTPESIQRVLLIARAHGQQFPDPPPAP